MLMNTITQTPVGADVSRTSPMYRPSGAFRIIPPILFTQHEDARESCLLLGIERV